MLHVPPKHLYAFTKLNSVTCKKVTFRRRWFISAVTIILWIICCL